MWILLIFVMLPLNIRYVIVAECDFILVKNSITKGFSN